MKLSFLPAVSQFTRSPRIKAPAVLTILLSCLISIVGVFSYYSSKTMITREIQDPQYLILQIDRDNVENLYAEMNAISLKVLSSLILHREGTSISYLNRIGNRIQLLTDLCSNHIESLYVYDRKRGALTVSQPYGYYSSPALFYDNRWLSEAETLLADRTVGIVSRKVGDGAHPNRVITLYRKVENTYFSGLIAVNADGERFFSENSFNTYTSRIVLDAQGERIFCSAEDENLEQIQGVALRLQNLTPETVKIEGEDFLFSILDSQVTGWRFCSYVPVDRALFEVRILRNAICILSAFSILAGFLVMMRIYRQTMKPVRRLERLVAQNTGQRGDAVDLDFFADYMSNMIRLNHDLTQTLERERNLLKQKFLEDLLSGKISASQAHKRWNSLFTVWETSPVFIAVLSIDDYYRWKSSYEPEDEYLLKYAIGNVADEIIGEQYRALRVNDTADQMIFLLQRLPAGQGQEDNDVILDRLWRDVSENLKRHLAVSVSIGLGEPVRDIVEISSSYRQASQALEYRLYSGYGSVLRDPAAAQTDFQIQNFLEDKSLDEFYLAVESGQTEVACSILRESQVFFERNRTPPSLVCGYLRRILFGLERMRLTRDDALDVNAVYTMELSDIFNRIRDILERYTPSGSLSQKRAEYQVQQMVAYMREHYSEDLSIADVAQAAGMGVSNASALFKKKLGRTIYDYLMNMRLEYACELLANTSLTVVQVAQKVGYQNEVSFRRAFKKEKRFTPGEYRQIHPKIF